MITHFRTPSPRHRSRRARVPHHHPVLGNRNETELARLVEPSHARELNLLRFRLADLLSVEAPDWNAALPGLVMLARLVRVQAAVGPGPDDHALDAIADRIDALFSGGE